MKKQTPKRGWLAVMILCIVVALACVGALLWMQGEQRRADRALSGAMQTPQPAQPDPTPAAPTATPAARPTEAPESPAPAETAEPTPEPTEPPEPVEIPIDFDYLRQINPDIYSWWQFDCTGQGYPVLQNEKDTDYYLHRDIYGNYSNAGALYTQGNHNGRDYTDPCTIIYGHDMMSGRMFGYLEPYTLQLDLDDAEDENNYFMIYTPEKALKYRISCAGVYSNAHILYFHDFSVEEDFDAFFDEFYGFSYGGRNCSESFRPQFGDNLCILLTCHKLNNQYRYLTIGVLVEEHPALAGGS